MLSVVEAHKLKNQQILNPCYPNKNNVQFHPEFCSGYFIDI